MESGIDTTGKVGYARWTEKKLSRSYIKKFLQEANREAMKTNKAICIWEWLSHSMPNRTLFPLHISDFFNISLISSLGQIEKAEREI